MKFIVGMAAAAFMTCSAQAADIAVRSAVPAPYVAPFTWTGLYSGVHVGYGWGRAVVDNFLYPRPKGWFGGASIGYNWQADKVVLGVEADFNYGKVNDSDTVTPLGLSVSATSRVDYFFTARGRLGFVVDRALLYGTGGFAWGHNKGVTSLTSYPPIPDESPRITRRFAEREHAGWTVGGGLEYALTDAWSAKAEYLYIDLGTKGYTFIRGEPLDISLKFHTIKMGLNYKFSLFGF